MIIETNGRRRSQTWFLPSGITFSDVIAAYKPLGASSEAASLINLASPGTNNLTKTGSPSWAAATGWAIPGSINNGYYASGITTFTSVFVRYSNVITGQDVYKDACGCVVSTNSNFSIRNVYPQSSSVNFYQSTPGFLTSDKSYTPIQKLHYDGGYAYFYPAGVSGVSNNIVYFNGAEAGADPGYGMGTVNNGYSVNLNHSYLKIGNFFVLNTPISYASYKIQAICFYNKILSSSQISELSSSMANL